MPDVDTPQVFEFEGPLAEHSAQGILEWMRDAKVIDASLYVDYYGDVSINEVILQKASGEIYAVRMVYPEERAALYRYVAQSPIPRATDPTRPGDWEEISATDFLNNNIIGDEMESNPNEDSRLTHRQKMDQVIDGLNYLTTQEVDALLQVIEAFKVREEVVIPFEEPGVCELPGIAFRIKDVSRVLARNPPNSSPGLSIEFCGGGGFYSLFESAEERDAALKRVSNLMANIPGRSS